MSTAPTSAAEKLTRTREVIDTLAGLGVSKAAFARYNGMNPGTISRWANHILFEEGRLQPRSGGRGLPHHQEAPVWALNMVRLLKTGVGLDEVRDA